MLRNSKRRILIAEHSKLDRVAQFRVCPFSEVSTLINGVPEPGALVEAAKASGTELLRA